MSTAIVRLLIAGFVLLLLTRAARVTWQHRALVGSIWRAITWRSVAAAVALIVVVAGTATVLMTTLPWTAMGLGDLVGFSGNAVFVPLEEAVAATPVPVSGPDWPLIAITTAFLGTLAVLLPWLAYVEEEVFRSGLERASVATRVRVALTFGLVHLVMLVPLAAALAIGVAGFAYGQVYRRAALGTATVPPAAVRAYRPGKRASRALAAAARQDEQQVDAGWAADGAATVVLTDHVGRERQAAGVFASTVLHTTFNTTVIVLVWISIVINALG